MEDDLIQKCVLLYNDGKTMIEISKIVGKNKKTIKNAIKNIVIVKRFHNSPSKSEIDECIGLYEEGKTLPEISNIMNIKYTTLYKHIRNKIIKRKRKRISKKAPIKDIIKLYLEGKTCSEISKILGYYNGSKISSILRSSGVKMRTPSEIKRDKNIKHDFFKNMGKEQCYWAGFLAADGCIMRKKNKKNGIISLGLSIIDLNHIEKYKNILNINGKTIFNSGSKNMKGKIKNSNPSVYVSFGSQEMFEDLQDKFNFTIRKSLTLEPPDLIPEELTSHFIRGYLDGDGWIINNIKGKCIGFIGTKNFLEWIKSKIKNNCNNIGNPTVRLSSNSEKIYCLQFGGNKQVMEILRWLYKGADSNIYLDRKYNIYLSYEESFKNGNIVS